MVFTKKSDTANFDFLGKKTKFDSVYSQRVLLSRYFLKISWYGASLCVHSLWHEDSL